MLTNLEPLSGRLLLSEPFLEDPNFSRSTILLTEHGQEGSVGFVMNSKSTLLLSDVLATFNSSDFPLYIGGPVELDHLFFIHRAYEKLLSGTEIGKGIFWGGNFETLSILMNNNQLHNSEIKFFLGYSGWSAGQLENELKQNSWLVSDAYTSEMLFDAEEHKIWEEALTSMGARYAHLKNFPKDPSLN